MRKWATTTCDILGVLPYGSEIDCEPARTKGWYRIAYDHKTAYVSSDYVSEEAPEDEMELLGCWHITAYAETGYSCANGNYPSVGYTAACNSLPFGTRIYIEGIGERVIEDRGPSSMGDAWCDVYMGDVITCLAFGSQYRNVYLCR